MYVNEIRKKLDSEYADGLGRVEFVAENDNYYFFVNELFNENEIEIRVCKKERSVYFRSMYDNSELSSISDLFEVGSWFPVSYI